MKGITLNRLTVCVMAALISTPVWSAEANNEGPAETGPATAAKESNRFIEYLDRETVLGGTFSQ